jgi:hypothetical protein
MMLDLILRHKAIALMWFTRRYHEREFFGNVSKALYRLLEHLRPIQESTRRPERTQRKRGYQDHGSLRPPERWRETHDWSLTDLQNRIEAERESLEDTTDFLEGWYS